MTQYRVTAAHLNVRGSADPEGAIVGVLNVDEIVTEVDDPANGYWRRVKRSDGLEGFASQKYLLALGAAGPTGRFPWLPIAKAELGEAEIPGAPANPRIVEFLQSTTLGDPFAGTNETPWCSGFVNWCVEKAGVAGTDSAVARSWLSWGTKLSTPEEGCIVVFDRGGGKGHVGFFLAQSASEISTLGGNQGDRVSISGQDRSKLLGFRTHS